MPAVTAAWPRPTASIVLPTPGGPISRTLAASSMNRRVPRSAISLGSTDGWAEKSKSARVNGDGSDANRSRLTRRRSFGAHEGGPLGQRGLPGRAVRLAVTRPRGRELAQDDRFEGGAVRGRADHRPGAGRGKAVGDHQRPAGGEDLHRPGPQAVPQYEPGAAEAGGDGVAVAAERDAGPVISCPGHLDRRRVGRGGQPHQGPGASQLADGRPGRPLPAGEGPPPRGDGPGPAYRPGGRSRASPVVAQNRSRLTWACSGVAAVIVRHHRPQQNFTPHSTAPLRFPRRGGHGTTTAP